MTDRNWREFLSDPPRPHNLIEIMQTIILMAMEDAGDIRGEFGSSARSEFQDKVGYDLYDEALRLLDAPIFRATDADGEPTLPNEAQALSNVEEVATLRVPPEELKSLRETLAVAQALYTRDGQGWVGRGELLSGLIVEIDRHRPLGSDGTHGDLHTPTCGCEDRTHATPHRGCILR